MNRTKRNFTLLCIGCACVGAARAQSTTPLPRTPVAIENTNSTFVPSFVQVPQASPARPTVRAPAHIPPTGYLQFEQGFSQANNSPSGTNAQFALSQTTKIALTTGLMLQSVTQPYTYNHVAVIFQAERKSSDPGDLQLGLQGIVHKSLGAVPLVAIGYIRRPRAGSPADLDVGSYAQSAPLLLSGDVAGGYHYDSNLVVNEQKSGPVRRAQFSQTVAIFHPLFEDATAGKLGGVVELPHFTQPLVDSNVSGKSVHRSNSLDLLFAAVYSIRPNLVLDAAFGHGLT